MSTYKVSVAPCEVCEKIKYDQYATRMRALGADPEVGMSRAERLAASGIPSELIDTMIRIWVRGRIDSMDVHRLNQNGIGFRHNGLFGKGL